MGFIVWGINHERCPIEVREKLHFTPEDIRKFLEKLKTAAEISEVMILSTCNRVEFHLFTESSNFSEAELTARLEESHGIRAGEFAPYFYRYEGEEAIRHLFRVAAGLNSMVIGENEILGQIREAFREANQAGTVHSYLYRLVESALKTGKEVRSETRINEGAVSIASAAVELAEKIFGSLGGKKVMVLGTGEMSTAALKNLKSAGAEALVIASRNREKGEVLAHKFGADWTHIEDWESSLNETDILISATSAPEPIVPFDLIKQVMTARRHRPLFLIDIAVPRDIEPQVHSLDDVYLYNLDDLKTVADQNLRRREKEVHAASAIVDKAVLNFRRWLGQVEARPTLERFEYFLNDILDKELDRLIRETGADPQKKQEAINRIRAKLLHRPHEKIKEASENGGVTRYLTALQSLFDLHGDKHP